jgi:hypothetical protein
VSEKSEALVSVGEKHKGTPKNSVIKYLSQYDGACQQLGRLRWKNHLNPELETSVDNTVRSHFKLTK